MIVDGPHECVRLVPFGFESCITIDLAGATSDTELEEVLSLGSLLVEVRERTIRGSFD